MRSDEFLTLLKVDPKRPERLVSRESSKLEYKESFNWGSWGNAKSAWEDIRMVDEAVMATHRPKSWEERHLVVVRRLFKEKQRRLVPAHPVILLSRNDLLGRTLVRRHCGKQRQDNTFRGPLVDLDTHHPPRPRASGTPDSASRIQVNLWPAHARN